MNRRSILSTIVSGYDKIEPCIITALALRQGVFIMGAHGNGKSTLGSVLGQAADEKGGDGFRYFNAALANIINIAGFPNMEAAQETGRFSFIATENSIFGGKVIMIDELPRAKSDNQNGWLEVIQERSFMGIPLDYDLIIATGNDETYSGSFKLDLALKSRFMYWLPAPNFKTVESQEVMDMIRLNLEGARPVKEIAVELRDLIHDIRCEISNLMQNEAFISQASTFIGTFTQFLKDKIASTKSLADNPEAYIPPREFANQMIYSIVGLTAYFRTIGSPNAMERAGEYTIKYNIETRHATAGVEISNICSMAWRRLCGMLVDNVETPEGQMKMQYASAINAVQKVAFWREHLSEVVEHLNLQDVTYMAGETLQQIRQENIGQVGPFYHLMTQNINTQHVAMQVEGLIVTEVARKLINGKARNSVEEQDLYNQFGVRESLKADEVAHIMSVGN